MQRTNDIFRALKYRNFRLFFPGLAATQVGIWVQNVAISWLVYDLTQSPLMMGTVMFFNAIPLLLVTPFAGIIVDKLNRHKLLMAVQILFAVQALLFTLVTAAGAAEVWSIIALGILLNTIVAIDTPLRQSTFVYLVDDKRDLSNAISLNSSCFNLARLVGPAIGGLLLAHTPIYTCFLVNFLCLVPSIVLVGMMRITEVKSEAVQRESFMQSMQVGLAYSWGTPQIRYLLAYMGVFCFFIMVYPMLAPIYTAEVLHADADMLGYLLAATGVGSLLSSILTAALSSTTHVRKILLGGVLLSCVSMAGLGLTQSPASALGLMFLLGFGSTTFLTPETMLIQAVIDDDKRGRVMALNGLCYLAPTSFASLFAGSAAHALSLPGTLYLLSALMLALALFISFRLSQLHF